MKEISNLKTQREKMKLKRVKSKDTDKRLKLINF